MDVPLLTWPGKKFDRYHILVPSGWFGLQRRLRGQLSAPGYPEQAVDYNPGSGFRQFRSRLDDKYVRLWRSAQTKLTDQSRPGPSPQLFDQLAFQRIQVVCRTCNQRSSTNEFLCTTRRPYQSLKKIDNIDKFTSPLTQKKEATKAPKQKLLRKRCFNPQCHTNHMPCLGLKKSAMSTQAKDGTTLQLLRARFREAFE